MLLFMLGSVSSSCVWICTTKDVWTNPNCWDCGRVPEETTEVTIDYPTQVIISGDVSAQTLSISRGAELQCTEGSLLIIDYMLIETESTLEIQNDTFLLKGISNDTEINNNGTIMGHFNIQSLIINNYGIFIMNDGEIQESILNNYNYTVVDNIIMNNNSSLYINNNSSIKINNSLRCYGEINIYNSNVYITYNSSLIIYNNINSNNSSWFLSSGSKLIINSTRTYWYGYANIYNYNNTNDVNGTVYIHNSDILFHDTMMNINDNELYIINSNITLQGTTYMSIYKSYISYIYLFGINSSRINIRTIDDSIYKDIHIQDAVIFTTNGQFEGNIAQSVGSVINIINNNIMGLRLSGRGTVYLSSNDNNDINIYDDIILENNDLIINNNIIFNTNENNTIPQIRSNGIITINSDELKIMISSVPRGLIEKYNIIDTQSYINNTHTNVSLLNPIRSWSVKWSDKSLLLSLGKKLFTSTPNLFVNVYPNNKIVNMIWNCSNDCTYANYTIINDGNGTIYDHSNIVNIVNSSTDNYQYCHMYNATARYEWSWYSYNYLGDINIVGWINIPMISSPNISKVDGMPNWDKSHAECPCNQYLLDYNYIFHFANNTKINLNKDTYKLEYEMRPGDHVTISCQYITGQVVNSYRSTVLEKSNSIIGEHGIMVVCYIIIAVFSALFISIIAYNSWQSHKESVRKNDEDRERLLPSTINH